ncbi:MAG: C40 family peptidase [Solirubrobacterales bacterium]|nr:C40 family peptidase [Solirubrobacterales bacterium]
MRQRIATTLLAAVVLFACFGSGALLGSAQAASGGFSSASEPVPVETPAGEPGVSTLVGEKAIAPPDAPPAVTQAIAAANRIRSTPYVWGGGHGRWWDRGYDCSGSVSYALHGGGLLEAPLVSGSFTTWGEPGPGTWITIYANRKHVYAVIAGLRWDTGGDLAGTTGPRWHAEPPYPKGFVVRHPVGY